MPLSYGTFGTMKYSRILPHQLQPCVSWSPPPLDLFKINYDGAVFAGQNRSGIGIVILDSQGLVIASLVQQVSQAYKLVEIEVMAATKALEFGLEMGLDKAVVEGDFATVFHALEKREACLAPFGLLVKDGLGFANSFSKLTYSLTRREGNKVAHSLARLEINFPNCVVWMEDAPPQVCSVIQADLAVLPK